jgi:hypothetical protein
MGKWAQTTFTASGYADADDAEAKNRFRWRMEEWLVNLGEG